MVEGRNIAGQDNKIYVQYLMNELSSEKVEKIE